MSGAAGPLKGGRRGILLVLVFAVLWAALEGALAAELSRTYNLLEVVWWRYATHLTVMLAWCAARPIELWRTRRRGFQIGRSLLMLIMPLSFVMAIVAGASVDLVWSVFWVSPLLILVLARLFLGEKAPPLFWVVAALGWAGAVATHLSAIAGHWLGLLSGVGMALSFSLYVVMTRSLHTENVRANLFYTAFGVFAVLTPLMPFVWSWPSLHDAVVLAAIGVVGLLALLALDRSVDRNPVSVVAPIFSLQFVIGPALLWLVGQGQLSRRILAVGLVLAGASLLVWWAAPRISIRETRPLLSRSSRERSAVS